MPTAKPRPDSEIERVYVDITDVYDAKLAALMSHASQHPDLDGSVAQERFAVMEVDAAIPRLAPIGQVF